MYMPPRQAHERTVGASIYFTCFLFTPWPTARCRKMLPLWCCCRPFSSCRTVNAAVPKRRQHVAFLLLANHQPSAPRPPAPCPPSPLATLRQELLSAGQRGRRG